MRTLPKLLCNVLVVLLWSTVAAAQTATVTRNVNLRPTPSTIDDPKRLLSPPEVVTLLSLAKDEGYFKVRTSDGLEGFVWANNVQVDAPSLPEPTVAPLATTATLPTLPSCDMPDSTRSRWTMKTRAGPVSATEQNLSVTQMIGWAVPFNLPSSARTANQPITPRETTQTVYALTGYVRAVKLQDNDCEFHVEVASSRIDDAPRVIVEIPQHEETAGRTLMHFVGMPSGGRTKNISAANAVRLTFVGYAFLDQWHQTNPATKEGHGHGKPGEVRTLWELHPVWSVRRQ